MTRPRRVPTRPNHSRKAAAHQLGLRRLRLLKNELLKADPLRAVQPYSAKASHIFRSIVEDYSVR